MAWEKQEARDFRSPGFFLSPKKQGFATSATWTHHRVTLVKSLHLSVPPFPHLQNGGQYVIYLPQRGGMNIKKIDLQIFPLGFQEGATSEPLNC